MKLIFSVQINIKVSYELISLGIKASYKLVLSLMMVMIKHSESTQSNKFAISLQKNVEKTVRYGVHFLHTGKHQAFYKLELSFLMEVARRVQGTKNRKLVIFLQYIKKEVSQLLLCSVVIQNIQIFYVGPVMFFVTCSGVIFEIGVFKNL